MEKMLELGKDILVCSVMLGLFANNIVFLFAFGAGLFKVATVSGLLQVALYVAFKKWC